MALNFQNFISMSFESGIANCGKVFTFDIATFGQNVHRILIMNYDINIGPIDSKAVTSELVIKK